MDNRAIEAAVLVVQAMIDVDWMDYAPLENERFTRDLPEFGLVSQTFSASIHFTNDWTQRDLLRAFFRWSHDLKEKMVAVLPPPRFVRIWPEINTFCHEDGTIVAARIRARLYVPEGFCAVQCVQECEETPELSRPA